METLTSFLSVFSTSTVAVVAVSVAVIVFFAYHIVKAIMKAHAVDKMHEEREKVSKELHDEICGGGSIARISQLYARLQELDGKR